MCFCAFSNYLTNQLKTYFTHIILIQISVLFMWSDAEIQEIDSSFGNYLCDRNTDKHEETTLLHILDLSYSYID